MYTLDTNFIIRFLSGDTACFSFAKEHLLSARVIAPTLVRTELLSKKNISQTEYTAIVSFLEETEQVSLDTRIADLAGAIRREYTIKTPDAIIAATAIVTGSILVTANTSDFKKVKELQIVHV